MAELIGVATEGVYEGKPLRIYRGIYKTPFDDPNFSDLDGRLLGRDAEVDVELAIHPNLSRKIIVNVPGANGVIDGFADKYKKLARLMQGTDLGAVVRVGNHFSPGFLPNINLRKAMEYVGQHAWEICGDAEPEVFLMGFSAGASAIAADAHKYPAVTRILLGAPSGNMGLTRIADGLKRFRGEVYIMVGENDEVVGNWVGDVFYDLATAASHREHFLLPDCDHRFTGEANSRIMSEAPFYAFSKSGKPEFPDPTGGVKLYD